MKIYRYPSFLHSPLAFKLAVICVAVFSLAEANSTVLRQSSEDTISSPCPYCFCEDPLCCSCEHPSINYGYSDTDLEYETDCDLYQEEVRCVSSILELRHTDPGGLGYNCGYTTFAGLFIPNWCDWLWPFIDVRAHVFNNGKWAGNAGLGFRFNPCDSSIIYGINGYFDYLAHEKHCRHFMQGGVGIEILSNCWEFRVNGYIPITHRKTCQTFTSFYPDSDFFITNNRSKRPLWGVDAELGGYYSQCCSPLFYLGAGPYYYQRRFDHGPRIFGGRVRLSIEYCNFMVEGIYTYDKFFKNRLQGVVALFWPIGCCCPSTCYIDWMASRSVYRNEIILLDSFNCYDFNF